jgi:hypothetical protein
MIEPTSPLIWPSLCRTADWVRRERQAGARKEEAIIVARYCPRSPSAGYPVTAQSGRLRSDIDPVQAGRVLAQDFTFDL